MLVKLQLQISYKGNYYLYELELNVLKIKHVLLELVLIVSISYR